MVKTGRMQRIRGSLSFPRPVVKLKMLTQLDVRTESPDTYKRQLATTKLASLSIIIILVECLALWGERERSRRQYRSQVSVFKPALFTEHSNTRQDEEETYSS